MTTLNATYQAGTVSAPPRVLLQVAAAPSLAASYAGNFATTVDGWTGSAPTWPTYLLFNQGTYVALELQAAITLSTFSRTVTGLTAGQTYRFSLMARRFRGTISLGVSGIGQGAYFAPTTRAAMSYDFTATGSSHTIQVKIAAANPNGLYQIDTVRVFRTSGWLGTSIARTDANGTAVPVREGPGGQETTGTSGSATMTVTDYEAALTGTVSYTVTAGNGGTATDTVTAPAAPGVWVTLPATANPDTPAAPEFVPVEFVTTIGETSESNGTLHTVIDRADPIGNPGPLALRRGTVDLFCPDYETAAAARALLAAGDVAHLRQPSFPGLDLYFIGTTVTVAPEEITPSQRWITSVAYQEVTAP